MLIGFFFIPLMLRACSWYPMGCKRICSISWFGASGHRSSSSLRCVTLPYHLSYLSHNVSRLDSSALIFILGFNFWFPTVQLC
jgi:hypothetical protein